MVRTVCVKMAIYFQCFSLVRLAVLLDPNFEHTFCLPNVKAVTVYTVSTPAAYLVHTVTSTKAVVRAESLGKILNYIYGV